MIESSSSDSQSDASLVEGIDRTLLSRLDLSVEAQEYLIHRWLGEVQWFAKATRRSRQAFFWLSGISLVTSSSIALLAGITINSASELNRWTIAVLGLISAISTGLLTLFQAWPNWKRRSMTLERLKSEGRQFLVRTGDYKSYACHQDAFTDFVQRVEMIVGEHKMEFFSKSPDVSGRAISGTRRSNEHSEVSSGNS